MRIEFIRKQNEDQTSCIPVVIGEISIEKNRTATPSKLIFSVLKENELMFDEGDIVQFYANKENKEELYFEGYVFTKERTDHNTINVTAYDSMRYLMYKDTISYSEKSVNEIVKMLCEDRKLSYKYLSISDYKISNRLEENTSFLDVIMTAIDITKKATGKEYVLCNQNGKINLFEINELKTQYLLNEKLCESFSYNSSIDGETYNRIKLVKGEKEELQKYEIQDEKTITQWGTLQYFEKVDDNINLQATAKVLLSEYNKIKRTLSLSNVFGVLELMGGSQFFITFNLGDKILNAHEVIVDKVTHKFSNSNHFMDLELSNLEW